MKAFFVSVMMILLVAASVTAMHNYEVSEDYTLLNMIEESDITAVGTVALVTGVYRPNYWAQGGMIANDIVIRVETMIKGTPNLDSNHIIFSELGGTAYIPGKGVVTITTSAETPFKVGEQIMVFLARKRSNRLPHHGLQLMQLFYGKRLVEDSKVNLWYKQNDDTLTTVKMPLELAKQLGKAFLKDKDATRLLEDRIKAAAKTPLASGELAASLRSTLNDSARQIIEKEKK